MTKLARIPQLEIAVGIDHRRGAVVFLTTSTDDNRRRKFARSAMIVAALLSSPAWSATSPITILRSTALNKTALLPAKSAPSSPLLLPAIPTHSG